MAQQVFSFNNLIPAGTPVAAPVTFDMKMRAATVEKIEVRVPPGPRGEVGFLFAASGVAFMPSPAGTYVITDDEVIGWPVEGQMDSGAWQMQAYNTGAFPHTLYVRFLLAAETVGGTASAQPLSAADLSALAAPGGTLPALPGLPPAPAPPGLTAPPGGPGGGPAPDQQPQAPAVPATLSEEESPVMLALYAGALHVFNVDATGQLQTFWQPPGGFSGSTGPWATGAIAGANGLDPARELVGAQFNNQQHVFARRTDGKLLHAFQSLTGQPSWDWQTEVLG